MDCPRCREALSARIDGEDPGAPMDAVDRHLVSCPACRSWAQRLSRSATSLRLAPADVLPDLSPAIVAAAPPPEHRWFVDVAGGRTTLPKEVDHLLLLPAVVLLSFSHRRRRAAAVVAT